MANDYSSSDLVVPALLASVDRDPKEAQQERQRRNNVAEVSCDELRNARLGPCPCVNNNC